MEDLVHDEDVAEEDAGDDEAEDDGEDVAEDDTGDDTEDEDVAMDDPAIALPCDLANFTVDLSDAFEFRQEGDQLIWETSEEKIMAAFQTAFDEWTAMLEEPQVEDMAALMLDDLPEVSPGMMAEETDALDEWLMDGCA